MTNEVGPVKLGSSSGEVFMGREWVTAATSRSASPSASTPGARAHRAGPQRGVPGHQRQPRGARQARSRAAREGDARHNELADIFKDVKRLTPRPQWLSSGDPPVATLPPVDVPRREQPAGVAASAEAESQTQAQPQAVRGTDAPGHGLREPWPSIESASQGSSASCWRRSGRTPIAPACVRPRSAWRLLGGVLRGSGSGCRRSSRRTRSRSRGDRHPTPCSGAVMGAGHRLPLDVRASLLPFRGRPTSPICPASGRRPRRPARVIDVLAARQQVQERLGEQIADAIDGALDARGVPRRARRHPRMRHDARRASARRLDGLPSPLAGRTSTPPLARSWSR